VALEASASALGEAEAGAAVSSDEEEDCGVDCGRLALPRDWASAEAASPSPSGALSDEADRLLRRWCFREDDDDFFAFSASSVAVDDDDVAVFVSPPVFVFSLSRPMPKAAPVGEGASFALPPPPPALFFFFFFLRLLFFAAASSSAPPRTEEAAAAEELEVDESSPPPPPPPPRGTIRAKLVAGGSRDAATDTGDEEAGSRAASAGDGDDATAAAAAATQTAVAAEATRPR